ncbi:PAC2 family protein [Candidatus Woesearchaeota archaeon]|nr:PAC2 family protein [Candidatus Woesearchaeota archaeon]
MAKGVELKKVPKGVTIIEGFPGFGLVATIATGFLQDHLKCEQIGRYWFEDQMPTLAVHGCKLVDPIGIFYNKQYNIMLVHSIASAQGNEWKFANFLIELAKKTQAKEIITLEGVGSATPGTTQGFFYTENATKRAKFEKYGIDCLGEGIIVGVTSALLLKAKSEKVPITCMFAETASKLPDSKAAAKIIEMLDKYLGLKVDPKPLLKQAEEFEEKLKQMLTKQKVAKETVSKKDISYLG